jgi:uncharacterized membrane protein YfcA
MRLILKKYSVLTAFILFSLIVVGMLFQSTGSFDPVKYLLIIPVMVIGALVAGSTPMGGGVIAFPAMTYFLTELSSLAAIYSLAIQSFGMTAASILLIAREKANIRWDILRVSIPVALTAVVMSFFFNEYYFFESRKLIFSSFWFGCGLILFWVNEKKKSQTITHKNTQLDILFLILLVILGSFISDLIGSGADFLIFAFLVLRLDESIKKSTYTSVIHMASVSCLYTALNYFFRTPSVELAEVNKYLLFAIPVVIFFAPLGSWILSKIKESILRKWIYAIILLQYLSAVIILNLNATQLITSIIIIILTVVLASFFRNFGIKRE